MGQKLQETWISKAQDSAGADARRWNFAGMPSGLGGGTDKSGSISKWVLPRLFSSLLLPPLTGTLAEPPTACYLDGSEAVFSALTFSPLRTVIHF